jgi:hypothetical protein
MNVHLNVVIGSLNVISRSKYHAPSNGATVFAVSLILCILCTYLGKGKWIELFTETDLSFNLHFQHIGLNTQPTGKPSAPFERA